MAFNREQEISFPLVSMDLLFHSSYLETINETGTFKNLLYFSPTSRIIEKSVYQMFEENRHLN